jgi:putative transposase
MARQARVLAEGVPRHIAQRSNNRQEVSLPAADRRFYLETLPAKCDQHGVASLGYCLINSHVHRVAIPERASSPARALSQSDGRNRLFSCALGRMPLLAALACVNLNPVRPGLLKQPLQYGCSSARAHVSTIDSHALLAASSGNRMRIGGQWEEVLRTEGAERTSSQLRRRPTPVRPFGMTLSSPP